MPPLALYRPTTAAAPGAPCPPRRRSGWTTGPPLGSPTPTFKRCRPRTPAAASPRTAWPPTPGRRRWRCRRLKLRARRTAAAAATEWGPGAAASPSRPRGNPFPPPWSPWQPPPRLPPPPRGHSIKVLHSDGRIQYGSGPGVKKNLPQPGSFWLLGEGGRNAVGAKSAEPLMWSGLLCHSLDFGQTLHFCSFLFFPFSFSFFFLVFPR